MLKYAIVGFGGLGKVHYRASAEVIEKSCDEVKLVALCDIEESAFKTQTATNLGSAEADLDFSKYNLYYNVDDLLANEELDFVITALPTYLHEKIGVKIMKKGINLFSEKPMAISLKEAENMLNTSKEMGVKLMIGQCCRYEARYVKLKELVDSGIYGKVLRADFYRLSPTPIWSWQNWFLDAEKSGGAALDLHVHDVDMINYLFGAPKSVYSVATNYKTKHDSIVSNYEYDDKVVTCTGEWGCPSNSYPFKSGFFVKFEKATVEIRDGFMIYTEDGEKIKVELQRVNDYAAEIIDFVDCIKNNKVSAINPPEASLLSCKIALCEKESADKGAKVTL